MANDALGDPIELGTVYAFAARAKFDAGASGIALEGPDQRVAFASAGFLVPLAKILPLLGSAEEVRSLLGLTTARIPIEFPAIGSSSSGWFGTAAGRVVAVSQHAYCSVTVPQRADLTEDALCRVLLSTRSNAEASKAVKFTLSYRSVQGGSGPASIEGNVTVEVAMPATSNTFYWIEFPIPAGLNSDTRSIVMSITRVVSSADPTIDPMLCTGSHVEFALS